MTKAQFPGVLFGFSGTALFFSAASAVLVKWLNFM